MKGIIRSVFLLCLSQSLWAISHSSTSLPLSSPQGLYVGIGAGLASSNVDVNHFVPTSPGWPSDEYHSNRVDNAALYSLLMGYTWATGYTWFPFYSLGLNYTYANPAKVSGSIEQYSLPAFTNYLYHYNIQRQTLLAVLKVDIHRWRNLMPFVSAGAGVSANKASGYVEQAIPGVTARVSPAYSTRTNTDISYALGVGFDLIATQQLVFTLEYNYGYFGFAKTGYGVGNNAGNSLSNKLTSNSAAISVRYYLNKLS